jgi:signal transduction histidine kinase/CheY-like chemotaxis protein
MEGCGATPARGAPRRLFAEACVAAGWRSVAGEDIMRRYDDHASGRPVLAMELILPDGRWIRHEAFRTHDGGAAVVMNDVTEARETARVLGEARDAAEAANRAKSEFLANMSHEIRTPLNGMLGVAQVLQRTRLTARQRELLSVMQSSGGLLDTLLSDLLDLARVEAGVVELRPQRMSLCELAASVRDLYAPLAEEKGLRLALEIGPGAEAPVDCDPVRLRQVLGNLVSNAVKFTEAGEAVLSLTRRGDAVRFQVRDTGVGFDEETKAELFQRFQQADGAATRRHGGMGLGLAICDRYVGLMGGELDCESRPGAGSTFEFTLALPALAAVESLAEPSDAAAPTPSGFRVLVVDDNPVNRQVLQLVLDAIGVAHEAAENGLEGVEAATRGGFDAVLMDIQMPVMDGFEATRRIRDWEARTGRPRTPLYIVSANCLKEHVDAGRAAGADGHMNKPIVVAELVAALQPHLDAAARRAA